MLGNGITPRAFKFAVEQWVATNRLNPTSVDLTNLYNTSVLCYRAANFWADNIISPKYTVHYNGEPVEDDDPRELPRMVRRPSFKRTLWRKNLTENFWGRDLLYIVRNFFDEPFDLHWINPNMYGLDYGMDGLKPFFVYRSNRFEPIPTIDATNMRIELEDSVYTHLFDFRNDFDGTAPAEVAFLQASSGVEMAQTWNATFRNLAIPAAIVQPPVDDASISRDKSVVSKLIDRLREITQGSRNSGRTLVSPDRWEWITLQPPFKDMDFGTVSDEVKEAVATAFAVNIEFFTTGQTNYAELEGKILLWRENTLKPRCEHYANEYTEQLAHPYFGREWSIVADFSQILPENESEKLANVREKMVNFMITIDKAQEMMGLDVDPYLKDFYLVGDTPVPRTELRTFWRDKLLIAPSVFNADLQRPDGMPPPQPIDPNAPGGGAAPALTGESAEDEASGKVDGFNPLGTTAKDADGAPLWVGLSLAGCADLIDKQREVAAYCADDSIQWLPPEDYHVTLFYAPRATQAQADALTEAVRQMDAPDFDIGIGGLRAFDSDDARGQYAVHFRINENAALLEFQEDLLEAAGELGIVPSQYSTAYKPHMTLGYAQQRPKARRFGRDRVQPTALEIDLDGTQLLRIPLVEEPTPIDPLNTAALDDLEKWRTKAKRRGVDAALKFESGAIPEPVQEMIRTALADGVDVNAVFIKAKAQVENEEPPATPEEFERYWRRYDALMKQIGDVWLSDYMQKAYEQLASQVTKDTDAAQVRDILAGLHDDVVTGWLGTQDKPGPMLEVVLGGMAAGNEALAGANPKPGKALDLNIDWELMSEEAYDFVQQYLFGLIRGIDRTTTERVQTVLKEWLASGASLDALTKALEPVFKDKARAQNIAQTESTRAYFEGSSERWRQAGVSQSKWRTVKDAMVCPTCRALNGTIGTLTEGWKLSGTLYKPPAHPGCRCWGVPVLE